MKKINTLLFAILFSFVLTIFAFADVAAGPMYLAIGLTILLPVLIVAVVIIAVTMIVKQVRNKGERDGK